MRYLDAYIIWIVKSRNGFLSVTDVWRTWPVSRPRKNLR